MPFASSTERLTAPGPPISSWPSPVRGCAASRGVGALPCLRPAVCVSTPGDVAAAFGLQAASACGSRSVLAVSHGLDGLLHTPAEYRLPESPRRMA